MDRYEQLMSQHRRGIITRAEFLAKVIEESTVREDELVQTLAFMALGDDDPFLTFLKVMNEGGNNEGHRD